MIAIIVLNAVFAAIVVGGIVGLLARSIWTSRSWTERVEVSAQARRQPARTRTARRRLAAVSG
jgi:hypothetical protein